MEIIFKDHLQTQRIFECLRFAFESTLNVPSVHASRSVQSLLYVKDICSHPWLIPLPPPLPPAPLRRH